MARTTQPSPCPFPCAHGAQGCTNTSRYEDMTSLGTATQEAPLILNTSINFLTSCVAVVFDHTGPDPVAVGCTPLTHPDSGTYGFGASIAVHQQGYDFGHLTVLASSSGWTAGESRLYGAVWAPVGGPSGPPRTATFAMYNAACGNLAGAEEIRSNEEFDGVRIFDGEELPVSMKVYVVSIDLGGGWGFLSVFFFLVKVAFLESFSS